MKHIFCFFKFVIMVLFFFSFCKPPLYSAVLGDMAPPLKIKKWVNGREVKPGDGKNTVIVEFWSTRCPHCIECIPLMSDLNREYKGKNVIIMGITGESAEDVEKFLKKHKEKIEYTIAIDNDNKTKEKFMYEFAVQGVPHAFIIDKKGRIIWEGHPKDGMDDALKKITQGKYDLEKALNKDTGEVLFATFAFLSNRTKEAGLVDEIGRKILDTAREDKNVLRRFAGFIVTGNYPASPSMELALKAIRRAYEISGGNDEAVNDTYMLVLEKTGHEKELNELKDLLKSKSKAGKRPETKKNGG